MARSSVRFATLLAWSFGAITVFALWHRFRYAAELTDEAFSIALPYRFALGDKPFVDEASIAQTAGILVFPLVWLYVKVTGGTSGIVLFCRGLHLAVKGIAGLSVHSAARRWLSPPAAIACAFVALSFVPHSIPNVGYNVLGMTLLVISGFTSAAAISRPEPHGKQLFLAGLAYGLATFAYPTVAPAAIVAGVLVLSLSPRARLKSTAVFVAGGAAAFVLVAPSLLFGGARGVRESVEFASALVPRGQAKLLLVARALWDGAPDLLVGSAIALAVVRAARSQWLTSLVVPAVVAVAVFWFRTEAGTYKGALDLVTYAGLLAPTMLVVVSPHSVVLRGGLMVAIPSLVAGVCTAWGSSNGTENACLGLWPAAVLFVVLAVAALERAHAERVWAILPAVVLTIVLVLRTYEFVYRDAPLEALTTKITSGPFRGIHTTKARASQFAELERVMRLHDRPGGRLLVLYEQPGISLFSRMPPGSNTAWPLSWYGQPELLAYWQAHVTGRGMIIRVDGNGVGTMVDPLALSPDRIIDRGSFFVVYRE